MSDRLRIRINPENLDHHLWSNNGTWFIHFTVHKPDFTKQRVRQSLRTKSLAKARQLRDVVLGHYVGLST